MSLEQGQFSSQEQTSEAATPEAIANQKFEKAQEAAQKIINLAEKETGGKTLPGVSLETARRMLDSLTWDRNYQEPNSDTFPLNKVPNEVLEAQRLLYTSYTPSLELQHLQKDKYEKLLASIPSEELEATIGSWNSKSISEKKDFFARFSQQLCSAFDFQKPVKILFQEQATSDAEAFYLQGQGVVAIPPNFFEKRGLFDALEMLSHEINHGYQDEIATRKETIVPDAEWFRLEKERNDFIVAREFNQVHDRYLSNPTEQDSYNAQKIFRAAFEEKTSLILSKKLEEAGLPELSEVRKIKRIYDVLDEFDMVGIPMDNEHLSDRLSEEEIKSINVYGPDLKAAYAYTASVNAKVSSLFKGII